MAQAYLVDADGERFDVTAELAAAVGSAFSAGKNAGAAATTGITGTL